MAIGLGELKKMQNTRVHSMAPQCVHKILSNITFLETRIQPLHDGMFIVEKVLSLEMRDGVYDRLYTGGNFKQNFRKKSIEIV